ncbi:NADH-FMN oxidoreductase RutF, flavin reductase (DIM6/NTAB) family [Tranquillimonas rosea]|uniref:NADH-FMN oxidoreductase RutF, flavin reductase (DIM6/NTAB) family n=1 Tax=Tranquillimonas rosea TaxID=641238 RepID=A0A1H9Q6X4_9RHOB|nr:flavin reductase family protein [Tranquillimonas rosea]SER56221.1 NADH-FMN oxidoreductase RutF, flavin reductase (DIM6/NTAB) family [Tranquillimonas rosea]
MTDSFSPGPDTARAYRDALGRFATGVTVITCMTEDGPLGITANSFSSVSLEPPLVLWSPAKASKRFVPFTEADHFAIHVMGSDQAHVCGGFAKQGDAFEALDWYEGPRGTPLIEGCLARFDCARHAVHDGGDHAIVIGHVLDATLREGDPLLFVGGRFGRFTTTD